MAISIWINYTLRISIIWIIIIILVILLTVHSYRVCYLQKTRAKSSSIKLFKVITIRNTSYMVIIPALLTQIEMGIIFLPPIISLPTINNQICAFTVIFGTVCLALTKLALHLFVALRSQIGKRYLSSVWYKIGLVLILSDVLYIVFIMSRFFKFEATKRGSLCMGSYISLAPYIWFAMNDFVIGSYCLFAFVWPLRQYLKSSNQKESDIPDIQSIRIIVQRIILYSSVALISTMVITTISAVVKGTAGVLMGIDSVINSFCVVVQFSFGDSNIICSKCCNILVFNDSEKQLAATTMAESGTDVQQQKKDRIELDTVETITNV